MTNPNLSRVQQIQEPNNNGRGGIYLIRNFDPNLPRKKWGYRKGQSRPPLTTNDRNTTSILTSFHFDDFPQVPYVRNPKHVHVRIVYNPTTNPTVKGTPLVKRKPTKSNRNFVLNRQLIPGGANTFFNQRYNVQPGGTSQIFFPDLRPGEALYFEGNYTFHGVPRRKNMVTIFSPNNYEKSSLLTPNNLTGKTSPSNKRTSKRSSPNSPSNSSTPRQSKTAKL